MGMFDNFSFKLPYIFFCKMDLAALNLLIGVAGEKTCHLLEEYCCRGLPKHVHDISTFQVNILGSFKICDLFILA